MRKIEQVFSYLLENAVEDELDYIESYQFIGKSTLQWIEEAESHSELISDDLSYAGEPVSHSIMQMAATALKLAREAYKNL